ncbi:hypothetical protein GGR56DRAFT_415858 [Xylariaceae sp. FL0804]|nr:hypothetical protein GGR56DRAFT_415858 [Xylariaceae sp. FL0804]
MRLILLPLLAAAAGLVDAQQTYPNSTRPFNLVLENAANKTLDGMKLSVCHAGADVDALCIGTPTEEAFETYYFNYSSASVSGPTTGILTWTNADGTDSPFSQAMSFIYNLGSNLAFPMIWPELDAAQTVAFVGAEDAYLAIGAQVNDAVAPPEPYNPSTGALHYFDGRWYVCETYFQSYSYEALQFVLGDQPPQNPSCQAALVKRVFL